MLTGLELMSCPNQAVPAEVMHHIVHVESGYNPFAIGVVGGQLVRQPQNLDEAIATAQMLETKGYNYSLGVSQVNRSNLAKYGLDTYAKAFDPCLNLSVGSRILNECYYSSGGDWGKAFSCYYSGDFVTGFRQGYVQKIFASMNQNVPSDSATAAPIPLQGTTTSGARPLSRADIVSGIHAPDTRQDTPAYRVSLRSSSVIDAVAAPLATSAIAAAGTGDPKITAAAATAPTAAPAPATTSATAAEAAAASEDIFVPKVSYLGDSPAASPETSKQPKTPAKSDITQTAVHKPAGDPSDLRQQGGDDAFVF